MKKVVIFSGRFQPFHMGHYKTYKYLLKKFPDADVYIATSNKTDSQKSPFNFMEKKLIMTRMFKIPSNRIVQIKNPYNPQEILSKYPEESTVYVSVVGEKDSQRLGGKYFQPYNTATEFQPYPFAGYVFISPSLPGAISGTDVRQWIGVSDETEAENGFKRAYDRFDKEIYTLIRTKLLSMNEMAKSDLDDVERFADSNLSPYDFEFGKDIDHFFQRLNDPRNGKEITKPEMIGFFKRLARNKKAFDDFTNKYLEFVISDKRTNINIPFKNMANRLIAKTIMRKSAFKSPDPILQIETIKNEKFYIDFLNKEKGFRQDRAYFDGPNAYQDAVDWAKKNLGKFSHDMIKMDEDITLPVDVGDTVLMGRFKNKKVKIKDIGKDAHGMPTINGKKAVTFRMGQNLHEGGYIDNEYDNGLQVKCAVCGDWMGQIQYRHLLYKHQMTLSEYKELYPKVPLISENAKNTKDSGKNPMSNSESREKLSKSLKGRNFGFGSPGNKTKHSDETKKLMSINNAMNDAENRIKVSQGVKESYVNNPELRKLRGDTLGKSGYTADYKEFMYETGKWTRPEDKEQYQLYTETIRKLTNINFTLFFNDIPNAKLRGRENHLDHKISILYGYKNNIPAEIISHYKNLEVIPHSVNESKGPRNSLTLKSLLIDIKNSKDPLDTRQLLLCGGAYGHMSHPFDIDMDLTFGDLKSIVSKALDGELELAREKTDGQALAISWKNGKLIAARNKGNLANAGANAMTEDELISKFAGRGEISNAFAFAIRDLRKAISALPEKEKQAIFQEGRAFMNCEIIYPESVNVIPYGQSLIVFHGTMEYDDAGNPISENPQAGTLLAKMINDVNANVQDKFSILGPPVQTLPKSRELKDKKPFYFNKINQLQKEFGLGDDSGISEYHQEWWDEWIDLNAPGQITNDEKQGLVKRWAFLDKGFRLKDIKDPAVREWADKIDKTDLKRITKENIMKFERIFLGVGADVLSFMTSVLTANPEIARKQMLSQLRSTIDDIQKSGDPASIKKLELELKRLQDLGGFDKIVPAEGIVFVYKGNTYKLTGAFAPLNQILGIFKYSR